MLFRETWSASVPRANAMPYRLYKNALLQFSWELIKEASRKQLPDLGEGHDRSLRRNIGDVGQFKSVSLCM